MYLCAAGAALAWLADMYDLELVLTVVGYCLYLLSIIAKFSMRSFDGLRRDVLLMSFAGYQLAVCDGGVAYNNIGILLMVAIAVLYIIFVILSREWYKE